MLSPASAAPTTPNLDLLSMLQQASGQGQVPSGAAGSGAFNDMLSGTLAKTGGEQDFGRKPVLVKADRNLREDVAANPEVPAAKSQRNEAPDDSAPVPSSDAEVARDVRTANSAAPAKLKSAQEVEEVVVQIEAVLEEKDVSVTQAVPLMQQLLAGLQQLQAQVQAAVDGQAPLSPAALQQVQDVLSRAASGLEKLAQALNLQVPASGIAAQPMQSLSLDISTSQQELPGNLAEFADLLAKVKDIIGSQAQQITQVANGQHHRQGAALPASLTPVLQTTTEPEQTAIAPAIQPATQVVQAVTTEAPTAQAASVSALPTAEPLAAPVQQQLQTQAQPQTQSQTQPQAANVVVAVNAQSQPQTSGGKQFGSTDSGVPTPLQVSLTKSEGVSKTSFAQTLSRLSTVNVVEQIQAQVKAANKDGVSRIVVTLDPVELGEVEIKMEIAANGKTGVVVSVDRPQTLELLQKDMRQLQQVLTDAGLKSDSGSLSFNLRGGEQQAQQQQQPYKQKHSPLSEEFDEAVSVIKPEAATLTMRSGINIKA